MFIKTTAGSTKKIVANGNDVRAVFVGSQRVWPSGEAYFSWPYNSGLLYDRNDWSGTSMSHLSESITKYDAYQPAHNPGTSANLVLPWWSSGIYGDDGGASFILPANQGGKYRVQGTVDLWRDYTASSSTFTVSTWLTYSVGYTTTHHVATQVPMPVTDKWVRVPIDITIKNIYGYTAYLHPVTVDVVGDAYELPFAFSNVNVGITRIYT